MAQQSRRERSATAHLHSYASGLTPLVAERIQIAFTGQTPGNLSKVYLVPAEGGSPEELVADGQNEAQPGWPPDGNSLVFGGLPPALGTGVSSDLAIRLVDLRSRRVSTLAGSEGLYSPEWSPEGRYIAAIKEDKSVVFDLTTQRWVEVAEADGGYLGWSHDGRYIYFRDKDAVYRARAQDRKVEQVASLKGIQQGIGTVGGNFGGLAPDDCPLILREASSEEIYALDWEAP